MAAILPQPFNRSKINLHAIKVDMTPMVDLGFLLITFFIFTTSLSQPTITRLTMPTKDEGTTTVNEKELLTLLVDKRKVFVYEGDWEKAVVNNRIYPSTYHHENGVGSYIRKKQAALEITNQQDNLMIAIKPVSAASYQDVINALDEMQINNVKRYGIMQVTESEKAFLLSRHSFY